MKAVVVYESLWGNTEAVARAIAEGIGPSATVLSTAEATPEVVAGAELIVAGAPLQAFSLPSDKVRAGIKKDQQPAPGPLCANASLVARAPAGRPWSIGRLRDTAALVARQRDQDDRSGAQEGRLRARP